MQRSKDDMRAVAVGETDVSSSYSGDTRHDQSQTVVVTPGRTFGRYEIREECGSGGMGIVFRAWDPELERDVALKLPSGRHGGEEIERFRREARAMAKFRHPHVCPVYDFGDVEGQPYLAMAFVDGPTLRHVQNDGSRERLDVCEVARIVSAVATGIGHAHASGIVHRDLKPGNVMLDADGQPLVMDFGLVGRLDTDADIELTTDGSILGTPGYMSPEQAGGETDKIGPASDVFSLGVLFYELLCGRRPFEGNAAQIIRQVREESPPPLENVDPALARICLRMLARQIEDRPTADEVAEALKRWQGERDGARDTETVAVPPPVRRKRSLWRRIAWGMAALIAATVIVIKTTNGTVHIELEPKPATIKVNGEAVAITREGATPVKVSWTASNLVIDCDGFKVVSRRVSLVDKFGGRIKATLEPLPHEGDDDEDAKPPKTAKLIQRFEGHTAPLRHLTFSPDGRHLFSGGYDNTVRMWDVESGKEVQRFSDAGNAISWIDVTNDGRYVFAASYDGHAYMWNIESGKLVRRFEGHTDACKFLDVTPDGERMMTSGRNAMFVWDVASGEKIKQLEGHDGQLGSVCIQDVGEGKYAVTCDNARLIVWDMSSLEPIGEPLKGRRRAVFSPDGAQIVSGSVTPGRIRVQDLRGEHARQFGDGKFDGYLRSMSPSPNGRYLATGLHDETFRVWNVESEEEVVRVKGTNWTVSEVAYSPRGGIVATGGGYSPDVGDARHGGTGDFAIRLWKLPIRDDVR